MYHVIPRDQAFKNDPNQAGKIFLTVFEHEKGKAFDEKGRATAKYFSVWQSQLAPIADYFKQNPKADMCAVSWQAQQNGRVISIVESL